ncbi:MAG: PucR family transcriptional regulator [Lachnospirales bacterium]
MNLTIRWLLEQDSSIKGFTCLAGEKGIERNIAGINIMDNPDTVPWLKKDELILSTGYILSSTNIYKTIVKDLYNQGCCGLGIKMNRYIDTLPKEMIEQANELGFTIFSIPFSSTMEQIVNLVYRQMFLNEMSESERMMTFYKNITEASLKRHGILPVLESIASAVEVPVFLTTETFEIIEYNIPKKSQIKFPFEYCKDTNILFPKSDIISVKNAESKNPLPVIRHSVKYENINHSFVLFPILHQKTMVAYLICLEENKIFSAFEYDLLTNINSLLCIAIINDSILQTNKHSDRLTFYNNLLSGVYKTDNEIEPLCRQFGFDFLSPRIIAALKIEGYSELSVARQRSLMRKIINLVQQVISETNIEFNHTIYDNSLILFMFLSKIEPIQRTERVNQCIKNIIHKLKLEGINSTAGIGSAFEGASTIFKGYLQAAQSLELGVNLHPDEKIFSYNKDMIYHLFSSNLTVEQLNDIYSSTLKPLDDYDNKTGSDLSATLYEYIKCDKNISLTAKRLFIHRNTMIYRIQQIQEIIDFDIKDINNLYLIQTAFYIKKILNL